MTGTRITRRNLAGYTPFGSMLPCLRNGVEGTAR